MDVGNADTNQQLRVVANMFASLLIIDSVGRRRPIYGRGLALAAHPAASQMNYQFPGPGHPLYAAPRPPIAKVKNINSPHGTCSGLRIMLRGTLVQQ